jgi:hypothetical protein
VCVSGIGGAPKGCAERWRQQLGWAVGQMGMGLLLWLFELSGVPRACHMPPRCVRSGLHRGVLLSGWEAAAGLGCEPEGHGVPPVVV